MAAVTASERPLRVAYLWNQAIQQDDLLLTPSSVVLGQTFPLPDDMPDAVVLVPKGNGYTLQTGGLGGAVWIGGQKRLLSQLSGPVDLGPDDYGVVTAGPVTVFFQHVKGAAPPPPNTNGGRPEGIRQAPPYDRALLASSTTAPTLRAN